MRCSLAEPMGEIPPLDALGTVAGLCGEWLPPGPAAPSGEAQLGQPTPHPRLPARGKAAKQAAAMAGVSTRWLYERARKLPFAKRLGGKAVRFSERGLRAWIESRKPRSGDLCHTRSEFLGGML